MADTFVESQLGHGRVTVFVRADCPSSRNAVEILKRYNFVPGGLRVVDVTAREDVQDYLQRRTGRRPVPCVFFGRLYIGDSSDLENMCCRLPGMLRQIGALR
ncbi:glutaredoxin-1-like [Calonectris borealis]|uniref:glutaredoxin-1-like n=1 Tax=Calonectris borealis TaxID=1323832 RepID=UPI003F4B2C16